MDVQVRLNGYKIFSVRASVFAGGWKGGLDYVRLSAGLFLCLPYFLPYCGFTYLSRSAIHILPKLKAVIGLWRILSI